jgi:cyclopropane-fatty-acyl-phospholipid synthase
MTVNHPGALRKMFLRLSERSLGEAYIANDFDIEGEMEHAFRLVDHFFNIRLNLAQRLRSGLFLSSLPAQRDAQEGSLAARLHGARHSGKRDRNQ